VNTGFFLQQTSIVQLLYSISDSSAH